MVYPSVRVGSAARHRVDSPVPDQLPRAVPGRVPRHLEAAARSSRATPTSPRSASSSGPRPWSTRPQLYGFNQRRSPSTCPRTPWRRPTSAPPPPSPTTSRPDEVGHRPGERHGHGPPDGTGGRRHGQRGLDMTPHLMARSATPREPGHHLQPKPWQTLDMAADRRRRHHLYAAVVTRSGDGRTASSRPPGTWRPRRVPPRPAPSGQPQYTNDWLIAFAPVNQSKVAIAVVLPNQPGSATGARLLGADRQGHPRATSGRRRNHRVTTAVHPIRRRPHH